MSTFTGAVIKEQGVTFGVVIVKPSVLQNRAEAQRTITAYSQVLGCTTVLMAQNGRGIPTYHGRQDIVRFLANVPMAAIPWKKYSLS